MNTSSAHANRYAQPTRDQLQAQLTELKKELIQVEADIIQSEQDNNVQSYKLAIVRRDTVIQDIESAIAKLHPNVPRSWFNKYGEFKDIEELKGERE